MEVTQRFDLVCGAQTLPLGALHAPCTRLSTWKHVHVALARGALPLPGASNDKFVT